MKRQDAELIADHMEAHHPCFHVHMIANGVGMLKERGLPVPAGTIPNTSWLILWRHDGHDGVACLHHKQDEPVVALLKECGYGLRSRTDGSVTRAPGWAKGQSLGAWVCPVHEREDGAA